ncbi:hypothetical protein [Streptomyces sp. NPDC057939]|uniref:hypothetical protein n=1 Tax=Streptomyces sp. NPDC057939 TaxID=3346284 RepID=UPI0036E1E4FC
MTTSMVCPSARRPDVETATGFVVPPARQRRLHQSPPGIECGLTREVLLQLPLGYDLLFKHPQHL